VAMEAIAGVRITPLTQIRDELGAVFHMLRADSPLFIEFGEIYFSLINPGATKAWRRHRVMTLNLAVPVGSIRAVLFDNRPDSPTRGAVQFIDTGEDSYSLLQIPPRIWYGFRGVGKAPSLIANCSTHPHDSAEIDRLPVDDPGMPSVW